MNLIKILASIKVQLEELIEEMDNQELMIKERKIRLRGTISELDKVLATNSFQSASNLIEDQKVGKSNQEEIIVYGEESNKPILSLKVDMNSIVVIPKEEIQFKIEDEDFKNFLIDRVFQEIKLKEKEFNYKIKDSEGLLMKLIIQNYGNEKNKNRIIGAIKWTFKKISSKRN
ncbi:MAG: hypothetical protein ACTSUV_00025 [Candidatus Ranarchaeia archaeon]